MTGTLKPLPCPFCADPMKRTALGNGRFGWHHTKQQACLADHIYLEGDEDIAEWNTRPDPKVQGKPAFVICPVRNGVPKEAEELVNELEREGMLVHFPPRDTDQDDNTGLRICQDNRAAIEAASVVYVIWDGQSQGTLFDLGVAFALRKPVIPVRLPPPSHGKSFQNMVREWAFKHPNNQDHNQ